MLHFVTNCSRKLGLSFTHLSLVIEPINLRNFMNEGPSTFDAIPGTG